MIGDFKHFPLHRKEKKTNKKQKHKETKTSRTKHFKFERKFALRLTLRALVQFTAAVVSLLCQPNFSVSLIQNILLFVELLSIVFFVLCGLAIVVLSFFEVVCCLMNEVICFCGCCLDQRIYCTEDLVMNTRKTSISLRLKYSNSKYV